MTGVFSAGLPGLLALDPAGALSQYHKRNWQVEDGLPRNYIMSVAASGGGCLLVGTGEGLARFDGVRFVPCDLEPSPGLSRRWIGRLFSSRDGSLWIGTLDGWIYEYREGRILTRFNAGATVFALLEDTEGAIWASTRTGVIRRAGGRFQPVAALARPPETAWNVLAFDPQGVVWAMTLDGLFRISGLRRAGRDDQVADERGRFAAPGRPGSATRSVESDDGVECVVVSRSASGLVLAVRPDRSGNLWLGIARGLFSLNRFSARSELRQTAGVPGPAVDSHPLRGPRRQPVDRNSRRRTGALQRYSDRLAWRAGGAEGQLRHSSGARTRRSPLVRQLARRAVPPGR